MSFLDKLSQKRKVEKAVPSISTRKQLNEYFDAHYDAKSVVKQRIPKFKCTMTLAAAHEIDAVNSGNEMWHLYFLDKGENSNEALSAFAALSKSEMNELATLRLTLWNNSKVSFKESIQSMEIGKEYTVNSCTGLTYFNNCCAQANTSTIHLDIKSPIQKKKKQRVKQ